MIDPKNLPLDIEEQRKWLQEHKQRTGLSWTQLANRLDMKGSTLSLFATGKYNAPGDAIAEKIFRFRQTLASQTTMQREGPEIPKYFPTETSNQLIYLLRWAQRGRIVVGALAAGLGKTQTADYYRECNSNVFKVTMRPSTAGLFNMQHTVLRALGQRGASGTSEILTSMIIDRVRDLDHPLLIIDEAQHLTVKAIDEIRSWHDEAGLGIALLGNESVQQQLDGGSRSPAFAQIFSRISLRHIQLAPQSADVEALLEAWDITSEKVCAEIHRLAQLPGALRGVTFTLELAHMLAAGDKQELELAHVQDAWAQLSSRMVLS